MACCSRHTDATGVMVSRERVELGQPALTLWWYIPSEVKRSTNVEFSTLTKSTVTSLATSSEQV